MLLSSQPLSEGSRRKLRAELAGIYDLFVERVADGRDLSPDEVHEVARGRVWTGAQALERGLVDRLGGLRVAVGVAKEKLSLPADADVLLVPYPHPQSFIDQFDDLLRQVAASVIKRQATSLPSCKTSSVTAEDPEGGEESN